MALEVQVVLIVKYPESFSQRRVYSSDVARKSTPIEQIIFGNITQTGNSIGAVLLPQPSNSHGAPLTNVE